MDRAGYETLMRVTIIAVGRKMPSWVEQGFSEYRKRLPPSLKLELREIPLARRGKDYNALQCMAMEAEAILKAVPERDRLLALDVKGDRWSTAELAEKFSDWQSSGASYSLLIGGPDGMDESLLRQADLRWSLSPLTLAHPLVRVIVLEQLYRAWTINTHHPYHRP